MPEDTEEPPKRRAGKRFWRRKRFWIVVVLILTLVWLDGPGWRWIARKVADHYLPDLDLAGDFTLSGRLSSGRIGIEKLKLEGGTTVTLIGLGRAEIRYGQLDVFKGKIQSVVLEDLEAIVDLDAKRPDRPQPDDNEEKEASDPAEVLRELQARLAPMRLELRRIGVVLNRGDKRLLSVEPSSLVHEPGSPGYRLELGAMEFPDQGTIEAQSTTLEWQPESLTLASLDLMPGLGIRELEASYAAGGPPRFASGILLNEVRFDVATDLSTAQLSQREGPLDVAETARLFGVELPLEAELRDLSVDVSGIEGGLGTIEGQISLALGAIDYDGWTSPQLSLQAQLSGDRADVDLKGEALGSPLALDATAQLDRSDRLLPRSAEVDFSVPQLDKPLIILRDRFRPHEDPVAPPSSSLSGTAIADFRNGLPALVESKVSVTATGEAPPIEVSASWAPDPGANAHVELPGVVVDGAFNPKSGGYKGEARLEQFAPDSLNPWLVPFAIRAPNDMVASLEWSGDGQLSENLHRGSLEIRSFEWQRVENESPLTAVATASYEWPVRLELSPLTVRQGPQRVEAEVLLQDSILALRKLGWSDGDDSLLGGTAEIPVPDPPTDWKALLRSEEPVHIDLESKELPLSKLHPFLPGTTRFPDASRARLAVKLEGTPAAPELDATFVASDLGLLSQPKLPPLAIDLHAVGKQETLKLEGNVTAPEYPPALIDVITNWSPDQWAEDPDTLKAARLEASARISDFNLGLLSRFLPKTRRLEGSINADLEVTGTVGEPKPVGHLTLDGGAFEMPDPSIPRIRDGSLRINATPERIDLESLNATISGGTLKLGGHLTLADGAPETVDLRLDATALPVRRDDSMIIRANAGLALSGPWETATARGTIEVTDSLFYKDIELLPIGVPFNQPSEPSLPSVDAPEAGELTDSVPAPFRDWNLDLRLKTLRPFLIRGNLANGEITLDASIGGTVARPRPTGGATLSEVSAKLPFSTLKIEKGEVRLQPDDPFNPRLDIRGESTVRPYEIKVYVYGPVSDPKVLPTSNPPLPETEIMTLLATGTTTAGFVDPQAATARAVQLLIEELRRGRIRQLRGLRTVLSVLDRVEFQIGEQDPYTSTKYNSATVNLDDDGNWLIRAGISEEGNTRGTLIYLFRFR